MNEVSAEEENKLAKERAALELQIVHAKSKVERDQIKSKLQKVIQDLQKAPSFKTGVVRIHTRLIENHKQEAVVGAIGNIYKDTHSFIADEREEFGGKNEGPAPLEYFISGLNLCLQSTFVYWASMMDVPIESLEMDTRAYWNRWGNMIDGDPSFTKIIYELNLRSPADEKKIREVVKTAETRCVVHATLRKAVNVEGQVILNGNRLSKVF